MDNKQVIYTKLRQLPWPNKTIIFAHMPKTAGISLNSVLKKQYGTKQVLEFEPKRLQDIYSDVLTLKFKAILRLQVISGHVIWGIHNWLPKSYIYITVLRDPVERILSTYSYMLSSTTHRLHNEMVNMEMSLEEFLDWDKSAIEINNLQCKLLSGFDPYQENHMPTVFAEARYNLDHYCLVGLTEKFEESLSVLSNLFGWRNVRAERDNVTPNRIKKKDVATGTIRKIEELNRYDMELYAFGQQLFAKQNQGIQREFARKITH